MMIEDILKNKQIKDFSIHEHNFCALSLSDDFGIAIECLVRFIGKDNSFICSDDHLHKFGLENSFDAEKEIQTRIQNKTITKVEFDQNTGDTNLILDAGILQLICNSAGYENYQINGPNDLIIVIHGGRQKEIT